MRGAASLPNMGRPTQRAAALPNLAPVPLQLVVVREEGLSQRPAILGNGTPAEGYPYRVTAIHLT